METYNVYLSGEENTIEADPSDSLSSLRKKIGSKADNFEFLYFNTMTEAKTILSPTSLEEKRTIKDVVFENNTVLMAVVSGEKTDLFGTKADWLNDRHVGVKISLNNVDTNGKKENSSNGGKFEPIMLTDVQPSNPNSSVFFKNAVICEKGSVIEFRISSWGAAGYGYKIQSDKDTIVKGLYNSFGDSQNKKSYSTLRRYQDSINTIQIESTESLKISTSEIINYQKVTIKTWRMTSYKKDGKKYSSDMKAPDIYAPVKQTQSFRTMSLFATAKGGFDPGSPGGEVYVPGKDIETAAPSRGGNSEQTFGSISNINEDDPDHSTLGSVVLYFFVFKDRAAAEKVINVLNTYNPQAIG